MHCMRTKYLISNLNSKGTSIGKLAVFAIVGMMLSSELLSAISNNEYVTVESTTPGVEEIYAVLDDFYITTRGVGSPPFAADIEVTANSPWYLKRPRSGHLHLAIGENDIYQVGDGSSSEEGPGGRIYVLKLDIEQQETNVCWKSTSCKLNLTDDSRPGGEAVWSSVPAGISGNGKSVTFNPSSLGPGEYTVTAKSGIVPGYFDTCVVRVIKLVTQTLSNVPSNQDRTKLGIAEDVICHIKPSFNAEWSVEGSGRVRTTSGSMNLFVADKTPGAAVLHAMVLGIDCSVQFEIVQPNGMRVSLFEDLSLGAPGDSQVGAGSIFDCVVLPDDVSFYNIDLRENIPGESFIWPDGSSGTRPAEIVEWKVGYDNRSRDEVGGARHPVSRLFDGAAYVDFSVNVRVPCEFQDENRSWVLWLPGETHPRKYRGVDKKARVETHATNEAIGGWMGPWK